MKTIIKISLALILLLTNISINAQKIGRDYVIFEAEETNSNLGNWDLITPGHPDYMDDEEVPPINYTHLQYNGNGNTALVYKFTCPKTATYRMVMRMYQNLNETEAGDKCNDVYVKMEGNFTSGNAYTQEELETYMKFYGRGIGHWGACYQGDHEEAGKKMIVYNLIEGEEYTFTMKSRSVRCNIDYILFYNTGLQLVVASNVDLAKANSSQYRPTHYEYSKIRAVDFHKFTDIDGFSDATVDNKNNTDVLNVSDKSEWAAAQYTYYGSDGEAYFNLNSMQEHSGESTYILKINGTEISRGTNNKINGTNIPDYTIQTHTINTIATKYPLKNEDVIQVEFNNTTNNLVDDGGQPATASGIWESIEIWSSGKFATYELNISAKSLIMKVGQTITLDATFVADYPVDTVVTWNSSDPTIASVEDGIIIAKSTGLVEISVSDGSKTATCNVSVFSADEDVVLVETFNNMTKIGWGDAETYVGDNGITWTAAAKGTANNIATSKDVYFANKTDQYIKSAIIPGGISYFNVKCKDINYPGYDRALQLLVNDSVIATSSHNGLEVYDFLVEDINIKGDITITIRNVSPSTSPCHIAIDDITWKQYSGTTDINDFKAKDGNLIYPNPFNNQITISSDEFSRVDVFNISGTKLQSKTIIRGENISIGENLISGLYIIRLSNNSESKSFRVIKTN